MSRTIPTSLLPFILLAASFVITSCGGSSDSQPAAEVPPVAGSPTPQPDPGEPATPGEPQPVNPTPDNSNAPFGLGERQPLANLNLPQSGAAISSYTAVSAYPNLSFNAVLFAASVPGEARIAIAEQAGVVKVFQDDSNVTENRVILDISYRVQLGGEEGLLGMAFDPNFTQNRYVYLHYSRANPLSSIVSRFTWDAATDQINESSEKIVLQIDQPFNNHNGGGLVFGPDGFLYIGSGDGGDGGDPFQNGQNLNSLLGKVLRLNVHPSDPSKGYDIPPNNPFINTPDARPEVYAYGFRNPFRFSFDRQTGELWLGDVGQEAFEEVNLVVAGGNYGWRYYEGNSIKNEIPADISLDSFIPPVHVYDHSEGVAVIGGYVYRGTSVASLVGRYLYADFSSGTVWALTWDGQNVVSNDAIANVTQPSSFAETSNGEVLIVSRYGGLFRLTANAAGEEIPTQLSQTGLFSDLASLTPAQGFIEYQPNHAFWSDGVNKKRWVGVPLSSKVEFTAEDWTFPAGTVAVKHFEYNQVENDPATARRLETRVMLNSDQGWQGFTYRWNAEQTDATLTTGRETVTLSVSQAGGGTTEQVYDFPSQADCLACHTQAEGWTLGMNTNQLNGDFDYAQARDNQIRSWNNIGLFNYDVGASSQYAIHPAIDDAAASVEARARTYLDVNCSICHQPGGPTPVTIDFRAVTDTAAMKAVDIAPTAGDLGVANARIIAPGSKERSIVWQRMQRQDDKRMPPLSTHVVDQQAVDLLGQWIDSLN